MRPLSELGLLGSRSRLSAPLIVACIVAVCAGSVSTAATGAPPATRLVFAATVVAAHVEGGGSQIYSVDPSGRRPAQLTFAGQPSTAPVPSPDGRHIAFERAGAIWVIRPDGRDQQLLVGHATEPAWTPDSRRVAYVQLGEGPARLGIGVISLDTQRRRTVVTNSSGETLYYPVWSPDGRGLAFGLNGGLVIRWSDGSQSSFVTRNRVWRIAWSPDGRWIASDSASGTIELVSPHGKHRRQLTGQLPAWSPDGRRLAFVRTALQGGIGVLDLARGTVGQLPAPPYVNSLTWSPLGDELAYAAGFQSTESSAFSTLGSVMLTGRIRYVDNGARFPLPEAVAWTTAAPAMRYRPLQPSGPLVSGDEVEFRTPVSEIATDGRRVAYRNCLSIGVWEPGESNVISVRREVPYCGTANVNFFSLALADSGREIAWGDQRGGNVKCAHLVLAAVSTNAQQQTIADGACRTTGDPRGEMRAGDLLGAGSLLSYSSWSFCDDIYPYSCSQLPLSQRPVVSQTIWRVCGLSWTAMCPGAANDELRTEPGPLRPLDVDQGRIVASGDNATLVLSASGVELLSIPVSSQAAELAGPDLVLVTAGELRDYDAVSGSLLHAWTLPYVSYGGHCGIRADDCDYAQFRLQDASRGLVAYLVGGPRPSGDLSAQLHVLRLSDGRDVVLASGTAARFGADGLFYAYRATGPWPGRISLVRFGQLPNAQG
jgi:Tol biopolymer transport system component